MSLHRRGLLTLIPIWIYPYTNYGCNYGDVWSSHPGNDVDSPRCVFENCSSPRDYDRPPHLRLQRRGGFISRKRVVIHRRARRDVPECWRSMLEERRRREYTSPVLPKSIPPSLGDTRNFEPTVAALQVYEDVPFHVAGVFNRGALPNLPKILTGEDLYLLQTSGRPYRKWGKCLVVCWCLIGDSFYIFKAYNNPLTIKHAEIEALDLVQMRERKLGMTASCIILIGSYSPCSKCAKAILRFKEIYNCYLEIWFTSLYKARHNEWLRNLSQEVVVSVSNRNLWRCLFQLTDPNKMGSIRNGDQLPLLSPSILEYLERWDYIWSKELSLILSQ